MVTVLAKKINPSRRPVYSCKIFFFPVWKEGKKELGSSVEEKQICLWGILFKMLKSGKCLRNHQICF